MITDITHSNPSRKDTTGDPSAEPQKRPLNSWMIFVRLVRLPLLPALLTPILYGIGMAWWQTSTLPLGKGGLLVLSSGMMGLALNLLSQYFDYRRSLHAESLTPDRSEGELRRYGQTDELVMDGYRCLVDGQVRPGTVRSFAYIALMIAVLAVAWLGVVGGWPLWFFGAAQLGLIGLYFLPPLRYGSRWWVIDDLGLLLAIGYLPGISAYYAYTGNITQTVLFGAVTPAVLAWLAFESYSLYSWHRDWRLRKRTPVVVLGPRRALDFGTILGLVAFVATIGLVAFGLLPVWALFVLGALATFLSAYARGHRQTIQRSETLQTIRLSATATFLAGLLTIGALIIAG
ncbi:MAG: prenyltransferase [Caldilineaceae bacterium]